MSLEPAEERLMEKLEIEAAQDGIYVGSPVYQKAQKFFGDDFADLLLVEYGCSEGICDGSGIIEDRKCPCKISEDVS